MLKPRTMLVILTTIFTSTVAFAQYVWVDEKGVKQFSDTPPPSSVPKNKIIKSKNPSDNTADASGTSPTIKSADTPTQKPSTVESRNEDYNKRKAEQAEKDKKAAEAQQAANEKSKNCERIKSYLKTLESGARITNTDSNGERNYMNDEQREKEMSDARKASATCQ